MLRCPESPQARSSTTGNARCLSSCSAFGRFLDKDEPVWAFFLVHIEPFTVVATNTLTGDYFGATNRSPFAGLLANLARIAFLPTLDPKHGEIRKQPEECADRT